MNENIILKEQKGNNDDVNIKASLIIELFSSTENCDAFAIENSNNINLLI